MKEISHSHEKRGGTRGRAAQLVRHFYKTFYKKVGALCEPTREELARAEKEIERCGGYDKAKHVMTYTVKYVPRGKRALSFFDVWSFKVTALQTFDEGETEPTETFVQEFTRCNNERCRKCTDKQGSHGPYWYAYWRQNGKMRKRYIGKELKPELRKYV